MMVRDMLAALIERMGRFFFSLRINVPRRFSLGLQISLNGSSK